MEDDFNTPRALAVLISYSKGVEPYAGRTVDKESVQSVIRTFNYFGSVFGIFSTPIGRRSDVIGKLLNIILEIREHARSRGDWATADRLRQEIAVAGIGLEDTPAGTRWYLAAAEIKKST